MRQRGQETLKTIQAIKAPLNLDGARMLGKRAHVRNNVTGGCDDQMYWRPPRTKARHPSGSAPPMTFPVTDTCPVPELVLRIAMYT